MMVNVRFEALLRAGRNLRGIGIAILFNFVWAPLVGWVLATIFLSDPLLALGFLLVMVVPCSSMAIGYTGLAKGDLELATVVVALSFVLAIVAVPLWMTLFASSYQIAVPMGDLINSILTVLLAPMVLGYAHAASCCCAGSGRPGSGPSGRCFPPSRCWACIRSSS